MPSRPWTKEELEFLKQEYRTCKMSILVEKLQRTPAAISRKASSLLKIKRDKSITYLKSNRKSLPTDWSFEDVEDLKKLFWDSSREDLLKRFKRTWSAIQTYANKLGLIRNPRFVSEFRRQANLSRPKMPRKPQPNDWTKEEDDYLIHLLQTQEFKNNVIKLFLEKYPNRTVSSIHGRRVLKKMTGFKLKAGTRWSDEQVEIIKQYYGKIEDRDLIKMLGRDITSNSLQNVARKLGLNKINIWKEKEVEILKNHFETERWDALIAMLPGRSARMIRERASRLGLKRASEAFWRDDMWTEEQIEFLKVNYPKMPMEEILGYYKDKTYHSIQSKASALKIQREEYRYFSEALMKKILDEIYPEEYNENNQRYEWLRSIHSKYPLQLDRFYPELGLAFEYNGKGHYNFEAYVGTCLSNGNISEETLIDLRDKFQKYQANDRTKREICKKLNIKLVTIRYDDEISKELVIDRINKVLQESNDD